MQTAICAGRFKGKVIYILLGSSDIEVIKSKEQTTRSLIEAVTKKGKKIN